MTPAPLKPGILYIDTAVGSKELEPMLRQRGVRCELYPRLPADFAVLGCGKGGEAWPVGVERKTLSDLGSSLLMDRLFGVQIPRMLKEYRRIWLIVEGVFRCGVDDCIEIYRGSSGGWVPSRVPLTWSQLQGWLMTYDEMVGGRGRRWLTSTPRETAVWLSTWLRWWSKVYEKHNGHMAIEHDTPMPSAAHLLIHRPNQTQVTAFSLPRLGAKTALKVGRHFSAPHEMMNAGVEEWREAGVGKKDASALYAAIRKGCRCRDCCPSRPSERKR